MARPTNLIRISVAFLLRTACSRMAENPSRRLYWAFRTRSLSITCLMSLLVPLVCRVSLFAAGISCPWRRYASNCTSTTLLMLPSLTTLASPSVLRALASIRRVPRPCFCMGVHLPPPSSWELERELASDDDGTFYCCCMSIVFLIICAMRLCVSPSFFFSCERWPRRLPLESEEVLDRPLLCRGSF